MAKNVIKEIIIVLLICLAIILLLGLLLYAYAPTKKVLPEKVSYTTPENIKKEILKVDEIDESKIFMTYEVDATDLYNYKRVNDYKPGKTNPFSSFNTEVVNGNDTQGNTGSANTNSQSNTSTTNGNVTNAQSNQSAQNADNNDSNNSSTAVNNNNEMSKDDGGSSTGGTYFQNKGTK